MYKWNSEGETGQSPKQADEQNNTTNQIFLICHGTFSSIYLAFGNNLMG